MTTKMRGRARRERMAAWLNSFFFLGQRVPPSTLRAQARKNGGVKTKDCKVFRLFRKSLPPPTNTTPSCRTVKEEEEEEKYSTSPLSYLSRPLPLHTFEAACKKGGGEIKSRNPISISSPRPAVSFFSQLERGINSDWEGGFFPPGPSLETKVEPERYLSYGRETGKRPC